MTSTPPPLSEHPGLSYLKALYRCRELGAALSRYATAATLSTVKRSLAAGLPDPLIDVGHGCEDDVCHGTATVARLVLGQELEATEHQFTCQPSEEGVETLEQLQQAVFGTVSLSQSLTQCVYLASLAQAAQALELVTAAVLDVVGLSNCLSLFNVAAACGCAPLRRKARSLALRGFSAAWRQDASGLLTMPERELMSLLCSDSLQVDSEMEVFQALAAWTEYDLAGRKEGFAARLARCVRLGAITAPDLHYWDAHPVVVADRQATMLGAQIYMHLVMGLPVDCPLGFDTNPRRRVCQRGAAAGAAQPSSSQTEEAEEQCCGNAEHAGMHSSVFEAAACAFAQQRRQRAKAAAEAAATADTGHLCAGPCGSGCAGASPAAARMPLGSPAVASAPTPTNACVAASASVAPAVQPTTRVRQLGISKRVGSRRTLFDIAGKAEAAGKQPQGAGSSKSPGGAASSAALQQAAALDGRGAFIADMVAGVAVEQAMSPCHASLRAMAQRAAAAAAGPHPAGWDSRKRLRFD